MNRQKTQSPRLARWLIKYFINSVEHDSLIGDFDEMYDSLVHEVGHWKARLWYWHQITIAVASFLKHRLYWSMTMIMNYLKTTLRSMVKQKVYSIINLTGLAIGLTCCILIFLFVADEVSFDSFHKNRASLFRIVKNNHHSDGSIASRYPHLPPTAGEDLIAYFPEIKYYTRHLREYGIVRYQNTKLREQIDLVDSQFFEMFSFPFIYGDPQTALVGDNSIILTRSYAEKYFGADNPMGKQLSITYGQNTKDYIVTGITEDVPGNSTITFEMVVNVSNYPFIRSIPNILSFRLDYMTPVYVILHPNTSVESMERKVTAFSDQFFTAHIQSLRDRLNYDEDRNPYSLSFQNIEDIHLDPNVNGGRSPIICYILMGIALSILIIACINFMNLSISMTAVRFREVGMRKVLGAEKKQLMGQFWIESIVYSLMALGVALLFTSLLLPRFNIMVDKHLVIRDVFTIRNIATLFGMMVITGIISGSYPALVMAGVKPVDIFRKRTPLGDKRLFMKSLVLLQFMISVALIISAILLGSQLKYLIRSDVGYTKEGLVAISIQGEEREQHQNVISLFQNEASPHSSVLGMTGSSLAFASTNFSNAYNHAYFDRDGVRYEMFQSRVNHDFIQTLGLKILQGRDFSRFIASDTTAVIVNQAFIRQLGMESPIGMTIGDPNRGFPYYLRIIGVVNDFHFRSLHENIEPILLHMDNRRGTDYILVRISTQNMAETVAFLGNAWEKIQPDKPFYFYFQDDMLDSQYKIEKRWNLITQYSSIFAIVIACMGVFGLTAMTISRRVKEIGIRKVLGARIHQVIILVMREFTALVAVANLIAWPVAYFAMRQVLQNYPFRINITITHFFLAGAISLVSAILTILYLALKAALRNPVESLKYE